VPLGTDAQRPGAPAEADFRANSDSNAPEVYLGGAWQTVILESRPQELQNKTLGDGTKASNGTANWTGTEALDPANGLVQEVTLTGNVTTLTDSLADGESIVLHIDDGTAHTITWPTITWVSGDGSAPTLQTTADTIISIWKLGSTLYGFAANGA